MKFIIGKKVDMGQKFLDDGRVVPVTKITAGPCFITRKKVQGTDGYSSIQIAYGEAKKNNKPDAGYFKKTLNSEKGYKHLKEFRLKNDDANLEKLNVGQEINVSIFNVGDMVKMQGVSRGMGFAGVVKRHGFHGGKKSHGHKDQLRMPGSAGAKGVAHVVKGKRMGGHMGTDVITVKNLEVIEVIPEKNEIWVKGAVPGARNGLVYLKADGDIQIKEPSFAAASVETTAAENATEGKEEIKTEEQAAN